MTSLSLMRGGSRVGLTVTYEVVAGAERKILSFESFASRKNPRMASDPSSALGLPRVQSQT
jgi:hypothetical protein